MTRTVGDQFYHVTMAPLAMAGNCLRRGDVRQGLQELSGESLVGSMQRAIDAVAANVGLRAGAIERLLPTEEIDNLLESVARCQADAAEQWQLHMAHAGGLLEAIAKLTSDGRSPETGMCLMRIATKMKLEKALATPLRELAGHIENWEELLGRIRRLLDDGKELAEARRRRRVVRLGLLAAVGVAGIAVGAVALTVLGARRRIDKSLTDMNPCEVELMRAADVSMASAKQKAAVQSARSACRENRESARLLEEKKQAEAKRQRREREAVQEREARCVELAARVTKPSATPLSSELTEVFSNDLRLLTRLAAGQLSNSDVASDVASLPCLTGPPGDAIAGAFAAALVQSVESWAPTHAPSPSALLLVQRGKASVGRVAGQNLIPPIEKTALNALVTGDAGLTKKAIKCCELLTSVGVTPHLYCNAVMGKLYR